MSCKQKQTQLASNPSLFEHWKRDPVLQLTLEADWQHLIANKNEAVPGTVSWRQTGGNLRQVQAAISTRGNARLNICSFPPLKLNFSEENLASLGLNPAYKSLKIVTLCQQDKEDWLLREYLTYRLLNELTDQSFRVQLAKVTYKSAAGAVESYAFLMENNDEMADRLGGNLLEETMPAVSKVDAAQYTLLTVFEYMIGNTDWSIAKQHNIKLVSITEKAAILPVPYDFDYSGLVNADYALPAAQLRIQSVRERFFQWRGENDSQLEKTLDLFQQKRTALSDLVLAFEPLSMDSRLDILNYLDSFYANLPQPKRLTSR